MKAFLPLLITILLLQACSTNHHPSDLQKAEVLLWQNPSECIQFLDSLEATQLPEYEANVCLLLREHATMKLQYGLEDDSLLMVLKDYFEKREDARYAGEANYIIGRNLILQQNNQLATFHLKVAESYFQQADDVPVQLPGATYYGLGLCFTTDRLFAIANDYYRKALPYFKETKDSLYLCGIYRDIVKSHEGWDQPTIDMLDSAFQYIPSYASPLYRLTMEIYKYQYCTHSDSALVISNFHVLCDSLSQYLYAIDLTEHYLSRHELDSASYYLSLSALDTANSIWSKEHYLFNKAQYLSMTGDKDSAIAVLQELHLWQTDEIEHSAFARSYMVEQRYDAEHERMEKEKALSDKHHAHVYAILVGIAAILVIATLLLFLQRERLRKEQKEERNKYLEEQLHLKQEFLQQQLRHRLEISTAIKRRHAQGLNYNETDYNELIADIVFIQPQQWAEFLANFDVAYYGLLSQLLTRYTQLTQTDQLYIALIVMGCNTEEISLLMNVSNQSVWNRKTVMRNHLGIDQEVEDWLQHEVDACRSKRIGG